MTFYIPLPFPSLQTLFKLIKSNLIQPLRSGGGDHVRSDLATATLDNLLGLREVFGDLRANLGEKLY